MSIRFRIIFITLLSGLSLYGNAQLTSVLADSVRKQKDSVAVVPIDSTAIKAAMAQTAVQVKIAERQQAILKNHPYYPLTQKAPPLSYKIKPKETGKEIFFYSLLALLLFFAILKAVFSKYFSDYLSLFFKTALKQKQIKQQLAQNSLPSLLFNILFVLSISYYIVLLIHRQAFTLSYPIWQLYAGTVLIVAITYIFKYLILKFIGWLLHMKSITESYLFVVFLNNKIIGVFILPFLFLIALSGTALQNAALTLSFIFLGGILIYRFTFAFKLFQQNKNVHFLHFVLYVAAFEILPILVFIKVIFNYLK